MRENVWEILAFILSLTFAYFSIIHETFSLLIFAALLWIFNKKVRKKLLLFRGMQPLLITPLIFRNMLLGIFLIVSSTILLSVISLKASIARRNLEISFFNINFVLILFCHFTFWINPFFGKFLVLIYVIFLLKEVKGKI
jgi:hypothetical protein